MKVEYKDNVSPEVYEFVGDLSRGEYNNFSVYPTTLKHITLILENLFMYKEKFAKRVLEGLITSLEKEEGCFHTENSMINFFIFTLFQMIERDNSYHDITYLKYDLSKV